MKITKKRFLLIFTSLILSFSLLAGCHSADTVRNNQQNTVDSASSENENFREFTDAIFRDNVSGDILSLHTILQHPENYGITNYEKTLGRYNLDNPTDSSDISDCLTQLNSFDKNSLSKDQQITYELLKKYLETKEGFEFDDNELFIVSGGQQCADLTTKALVNEGDVVLTEEPAFVGCLNTFRSYGAKLVGIPMEQDGMNIDALKEALEANPNAKLLYTIPSFQNPTGITTSLEKRKKIYELCCKYDIAILEDNPYGELRFAGENVPTIKSMDTEGRVIYAGSFSKVMAPAFRLGFLVFNKSLTGPLTVAKQCTDVHSTVLFQYICNEYINNYDFDKHLEESRKVYEHKCNLMLDCMKKEFHPSVTFGHPEGGLFVMAFLPDGMDSAPFVREAINRGVLSVPGAAFLADENQKSNGFRLNYSTPSDEQIIKGIEILGKLTYEWIK